MKNTFLFFLLISSFCSCELSDESNLSTKNDLDIQMKVQNSETIIVPVYLHLWKTSLRNDEYPSNPEVETALNTLNEGFAPANIQFVVLQTIRETVPTSSPLIENEENYRIEGFMNINLISKNAQGGGNGHGYSNGAVDPLNNPPYNFFAVGGTAFGYNVLLDKTIIHEAGHNFGLHHTSCDPTNIMYPTDEAVPYEPLYWIGFDQQQIDRIRDVAETYFNPIVSVFPTETDYPIRYNCVVPADCSYSNSLSYAPNTLAGRSYTAAYTSHANIDRILWTSSPNINLSSNQGISNTYTTSACPGSGWIKSITYLNGNCDPIQECVNINIGLNCKGPCDEMGYVRFNCNSVIANCNITNTLPLICGDFCDYVAPKVKF